jgi:hypothetical protein
VGEWQADFKEGQTLLFCESNQGLRHH